jgi:indolepyruvate ferredoxin oxidoreductase
MHGLRGTPMDPFGRTRVRVVERELIEEYVGLVDHVTARLSPATAALAVQLAELPDGVRGYEDTKLRNVESYRQSLAELRTRLDEIPALHPAAAKKLASMRSIRQDWVSRMPGDRR